MFYHTSSEGLVWLDRKGNPISLSHPLVMHIEAIHPSELWNSIQTWNKVHKQNFIAPGMGLTNTTTVEAKVPILTTPSSPFVEHHDEVRHLEGARIATVKDLLEDPKFNQG